MDGAPHSPEYLGGWLSEQLAEDGDIHELGVHVRVAGDVVFLSGVVSTEHRRDLVGERAAALVPGYRVCNEVTVACLDEPVSTESLA
ncbi:MAG TPA: BON domain-containing protein [Frankiaceae bacterium]|nr:BON domain-containing protein [Frankiaceae bacterium]